MRRGQIGPQWRSKASQREAQVALEGANPSPFHGDCHITGKAGMNNATLKIKEWKEIPRNRVAQCKLALAD